MGIFSGKISAEFTPPKTWVLNRDLSFTTDKLTPSDGEILELVGVGFRASLKGKQLNLQLGFSHDVNFDIPENIKITVEKQTIIKISGIDKQLVGMTASNIKSIRPPEPYKGKGIRYVGEYVARKAGKAAK